MGVEEAVVLVAVHGHWVVNGAIVLVCIQLSVQIYGEYLAGASLRGHLGQASALAIASEVRLNQIFLLADTLLSGDVLLEVKGQQTLHRPEVVDQREQLLLVLAGLQQSEGVVILDEAEVKLVDVLDVLIPLHLGLVEVGEG